MDKVLHIGAHKTATTHLQKALDASGETLATAGVVFLGPSRLRKPPLRFLSIFGDEAAPVARRHALQAAAAGARRLVLSEENVLGTAHQPKALRQGRFYPDAAERLARVIAVHDLAPVHLMLAVRDPAQFYVSAYSQLLYSGTIRRFDVFIGDCDVPAMRWSELVARLVAVDGVARCTVWPFEAYTALHGDILRAMLGEAGAHITLPETVQHPGLSARAHEQVFTWVAEGRAPSDQGHGRDARALFPKVPGEVAYQPWSDADLARSATTYAEDLGRIAALDRVDLLRPAQSA